MKALRSRPDDGEGGFTLIELLVVVVVIGVLSSIAIPVFLGQRMKGYDAQARSDARNLATLQESHAGDSGGYVEAPDVAAVRAALPEYKQSGDVKAVRIVLVDATGTAPTTSTAIAYCVETTSASTRTFAFNSALGGLQEAGSTCP